MHTEGKQQQYGCTAPDRRQPLAACSLSTEESREDAFRRGGGGGKRPGPVVFRREARVQAVAVKPASQGVAS